MKLLILLFAVIGIIGCQSYVNNPLSPSNTEKVGATTVYKTGLKVLHENIPGIKMAPIFLKKAAALPTSFDLSNKFPPVGDQGNLGSCAAFAAGYAALTCQQGMIYNWNLTTINHIFSPAYIYNQIHLDNNCDGGGANLADVFNLTINQGCATLQFMPYNGSCNGWQTQPTPQQRANASNYKPYNWYRLPSGNSGAIIAQIHDGNPVVIAIPVYSDFVNLNASNQVYDNISGDLIGYHGVCVVGYDINKNAVKIINSWNTNWGLGGYGWISCNLIDNQLIDAYIVSNASNENTLIAVSDVCASVYTDQQHFVYRDGSGVLWDSYYYKGWVYLQKINLGGNTSGPAAVGVASVGASNDQQHFVYRDASGALWDAYYGNNSWNIQKINLGGKTSGPASVGDPSFSPFQTEQHTVYRDASGNVYDAYYLKSNNTWNLQKINRGGTTSGPAAASDPTFTPFQTEQHIVYRDGSGNVYDAYYLKSNNTWNLQKINMGGKTSGPAAASNPTFTPFQTEQHIVYRDGSGNVYDAYYLKSNNTWNLQKINMGGKTTGPAAVGDPSFGVYNTEQHIVYRDGAGNVWDSYYVKSNNTWYLQKINMGGKTSGPAAVGDPCFSVYNNQQHITYRDASGKIRDSYYDRGNWYLQQLN